MFSPTTYSIIADLIAIAHGIIAVWLMSGVVFEILLRRTLPNWYRIPLITTAIIAFSSYIFIGDCPINPIENYFRELASQDVFKGSFIAHYFQIFTGYKLELLSIKIIELVIGLGLGGIIFNAITKQFKDKKA